MQKSECADGEPRIRSPLAEKLPHDPFPRSPLLYNDNTSLLSPHGLPPLKFHSGLLQPHSVLAPRLYDGEDDNDVEEDESVASVSSNMDVDNFEEEDFLDKAGEELYNEDKGEMFGYKSCNIKLNRGLLNNLKIEVPESNRRFTDGDLGFKKVSQKILTPSGGSNISSQLRERVQLRNAQVKFVTEISFLAGLQTLDYTKRVTVLFFMINGTEVMLKLLLCLFSMN